MCVCVGGYGRVYICIYKISNTDRKRISHLNSDHMKICNIKALNCTDLNLGFMSTYPQLLNKSAIERESMVAKKKMIVISNQISIKWRMFFLNHWPMQYIYCMFDVVYMCVAHALYIVCTSAYNGKKKGEMNYNLS